MIESLSTVFEFVIGIGYFIILLGVVVFVHELGHFVAAKLGGVYVLRFSLGWGKRLFGFKIGETDYCISMFPVGGYVRMVGQEDTPRTEEEVLAAEPELADVPPERRFNNKSTAIKLAISFAGPMMNVIFALPLLWFVFMRGIQVPISLDDTRIGGVQEGSPAEAAGIKSGQRVLSIDGSPISKWEELQLTIITNEDTPLDLEMQNISGEIDHVVAVPTRAEGAPRPSLGIEPFLIQMVSAVTPGMAADRAGLAVGDMILSYNDSPPDNESIMKLIDTVNKSAGQPMTLTVMREGTPKSITVVPDEVSVIEGIVFEKNEVYFIDEDRTSEAASKLRPGDIVASVNGKPLDTDDFEGFLTSVIYDQSGAEIELAVERRKGLLDAPEKLSFVVPLGRTGRIGVSFTGTKLQKFGPVEAFGQAVGLFNRYCKLAIVTPYYLVAGKLSVKEVSGPIGIAVMTDTYRRLGFSYYLTIMALITVHLGIINLLPIPLVDGGMIVLTTVEAIRRKPVEEKHLIIFQKIGVVMITLIFAMAMYNDALRAVRYFLGGNFLE